MSDDRRKVKLDRRRVNLGQAYEVRWWTKALGVTKAQLRAAVNAVGVEVKKVRAYVRLWRAVPPAPAAPPVKRKATRAKAKKR